MLTGTYWGCEWRPELPFLHFTVIFQTETNSKSCSFCDHSKVLDKYVRDLVTITWGNQDITDTTDFPRRITATGLEFISWAVWTGGRDQPSELKGQSSRFIKFVFPLILYHKTTESLHCFNSTMLDSTGHTKSTPAVCTWTQQCQVTVALQSCEKEVLKLAIKTIYLGYTAEMAGVNWSFHHWTTITLPWVKFQGTLCAGG